MGAFYRAAIEGTYQGQANVNILHYRTAIDVFGGAFGVGGAKEVATSIMEQVIPAYLACKPAQYNCDRISVHVRNETFQLMYQLPYVLPVNQVGTVSMFDNGSDGPALCVNIRFNLEPVMFGLQAFTAPKKGYVAIGPLLSSWIPNSGVIASDGGQPLRDLATALSQNLVSALPPAEFFPIRTSERWGEGGITGGIFEYGWADVDSAFVDGRTSFRRSRRSE